MAKLILSENMQVLGEFPMDRDCITIGRNADNDIQIKDRSVSGHHCQILTILNDSFIEDLESTNGTIINNKKITKYALRNGDRILVGTHQLLYENDLANHDEDRHDRTMVMRSPLVSKSAATTDKAASGSPPHPSEDPSAKASGSSLKAHHLKILNGTNKDKTFQITRAMTTLGKPGQQVAAITRRGEKYVIIGVEADAENRYPTVNETPVSTKSVPLNLGDIIQLNGIRMLFELSEEY